jgi:hypothetical protein
MAIFVVALSIALRVAWVLLVPTKPVGDFAMYVESAAHLVEHGSFDPEYVYMPGYIFLIAPVQALGGGWLATKLVGAIVGGLGAGAVIGIARRIAGGSPVVPWAAGLLYAFWPAGIAVASVTGTDMPAAVLVVTAAYCLLRFSPARPRLAAILFGVVTGLGAYIRAIVVPLAALSALVFRAQGTTWRRATALGAVAGTVALLILSPWAVRNRLRYGETFFTDSHGGLTALVGANPNTDGCYSRSLNRMFHDVTGLRVLAEPHRQADRASMAIAKTWITFDPLFTLGLLLGKAERLLVHERALLYWPLFRAGALPEPIRSFFGGHQAAIEAVADNYWLALLALAIFGCGVASARRHWLALSLLPQAVILAALYIAIFSEPRYRLPIAMLLMPLTALAVDWLLTAGRAWGRKTLPAGWRREASLGGGLVLAIFCLAPLAAWAGERLRDGHRFAVHECAIDGQTRFCTWRTVSVAGDLRGRSGVLGVWNGVGLAWPDKRAEQQASLVAESDIDLTAGDWVLAMRLEPAPTDPGGIPAVLTDGQVLRLEPGAGQRWQAHLHHDGGRLRLRLRIDGRDAGTSEPGGRLWVSDLRLERTQVRSNLGP